MMAHPGENPLTQSIQFANFVQHTPQIEDVGTARAVVTDPFSPRKLIVRIEGAENGQNRGYMPAFLRDTNGPWHPV
jgi:hypothetical protein